MHAYGTLCTHHSQYTQCKCHSLFRRNVPFYLFNLEWIHWCVRARVHSRIYRDGTNSLCIVINPWVSSTTLHSISQLLASSQNRMLCVSVWSPNVSKSCYENDDSHCRKLPHVTCSMYDIRYVHYIYRNHTVGQTNGLCDPDPCSLFSASIRAF